MTNTDEEDATEKAASTAAAGLANNSSNNNNKTAASKTTTTTVPVVGSSTSYCYKEQYTWPLTSTTTCYSGARTPSSNDGYEDEVGEDVDDDKVVAAAAAAAAAADDDHDDDHRAGSSTSSSRRTRFHLATERHQITVDVPAATTIIKKGYGRHAVKGEAAKEEEYHPELYYKDACCSKDSSTAGNNGTFACVGYTTLGCCEALVILDHRTISTNFAPGNTTVDDNFHFALSDEEADLMRAASLLQQHQRQQSIGGDTTSTTAPSSADDASASMSITGGGGSGSSVQQQQQTRVNNNSGGRGGGETSETAAERNNNSNINGDDNENIDVPQQQQQQRSKLILRNTHTEMEYTVGLDCRALAPTLCLLKRRRRRRRRRRRHQEQQGEDNDNDNDEDEVGIWLGSPDHNKLQFWRPSRDQTGKTPTLRNIELDDHAFNFVSPIMAIDCSCHCCSHHSSSATPNNKNPSRQHCLAIACQDGTIRLINFDWQDGGALITNLLETTVVVDGPLVCVSLQRLNSSSMHAVIGSLCGYVCELWLPSSLSSSSDDNTNANATVSSGGSGYWEGPTMVAEGYWNSRLQTEDSVLAVCAFENRVAVGTHSGRMLVYERVNNGAYELRFECRLPYSIHGLCFLPTTDLGDDGPPPPPPPPPKLLVTTRRSIHVFQCCEELFYDADVARKRLDCMLRERGIIQYDNINNTNDMSTENDDDDNNDDDNNNSKAKVEVGAVSEIQTATSDRNELPLVSLPNQSSAKATTTTTTTTKAATTNAPGTTSNEDCCSNDNKESKGDGDDDDKETETATTTLEARKPRQGVDDNAVPITDD